MKVEFKNSDVFNTSLFVTYNEFVKAKTDRNELESLNLAVEAFATLFDIEYVIGAVKYQKILDQLEKNGSVIFAVRNDEIDVLVSNNNQPQRVDFTSKIKGKIMK